MPDDNLTDLEDAIRDLLDLLEKERAARSNWVNEDKEEWQRKRVARVRRLLLELSRYV